MRLYFKFKTAQNSKKLIFLPEKSICVNGERTLLEMFTCISCRVRFYKHFRKIYKKFYRL